MPTPMMQQYDELKSKHKDAILLFRLGDFYEAFNDDAKKISKILNITLTKRGTKKNARPMAGIPHHALKNYLKKLIDAGEKVAIAEQTEEPQAGKLVNREITKIITKGTISDIDFLDEARNNYLGALYKNKKQRFYLAFIDLTTGEFKIGEFRSEKNLENEIYKLNINEILIKQKLLSNFQKKFKETIFQLVDEELWQLDFAKKILQEHFNINSFNGFGFSNDYEGLIPAGIILDYLRQTQKTSLEHITKIQNYQINNFMNLDATTINSLELIYNIRANKNNATLFSILNKCQTPMGQRLLRNWILHPLKDKKKIQKRLDATEQLFKNPEINEEIREQLDNVYDIERIISKIGTNSINARDLLALSNSLDKFLNLKNLLKDFDNDLINLNTIKQEHIDIIKSIIDLISKAITDDPPTTITEGGIFKKGFNKELDEIRNIMKNGKQWINNFQAEEIRKTGITSLKVKYNNVFGFYIEVTKANLNKIPDNYIRKQTLVNAERFITEELKNWEDKILNAQNNANQLEYELFLKLKDKISKFIKLYLTIAHLMAIIDVLSNFAHIARYFNYTKPQLNENNIFKINQGRHPVVEKFIDTSYIPNDIDLNDNQQIIILTGPNMSGKSTYIRQIALTAIMAQIGSFVPATQANLCIVDRIFTRVGASDNLAQGQSTFMVEMSETANILNNATKNSLVILDEIGRGTSTYDGVAIAWSIVEYIHEKIGAKTLFATHYHELTDLENKLVRVKNYNVEVLEEDEEIIFTRKVIKGATDQSYGVYVAKMAGVPNEVIKRAKSILMTLEQESLFDVKSIESELIDPINPKNNLNIATTKPKTNSKIIPIPKTSKSKRSKRNKAIEQLGLF